MIASNLDYPALCAKRIVTLTYCYPLLHTIEEGIKRLAGVFAL